MLKMKCFCIYLKKVNDRKNIFPTYSAFSDSAFDSLSTDFLVAASCKKKKEKEREEARNKEREQLFIFPFIGFTFICVYIYVLYSRCIAYGIETPKVLE